MNEKMRQLKEQIEALQARFDAMAQEDEEPWPQVGDEYFWCNSKGSAGPFSWDGDNLDVARMAEGNCHRTTEQAVAAHQWRINPRTQARRMVEMREGFDPVGARSIVSNRDGHAVRIVKNEGWVHGMGGINFNEDTKAKAAIDKLGEPLIKVALGVITGEEAERIVREAMGK